jgi:predicted RNase H-like HicB family nuclease
MPMHLQAEFEQEADGRWFAEIRSIPGVLAYGATRDAAWQSVRSLALRAIADRIENDEFDDLTVTFDR